MKKVSYRLGELFCGPGGLAYGATNAAIIANGTQYSIKHEWASDYDHDTCATYANNLSPENRESVIHQDVRTLDIDKLPEIDGFAYGFPCNDFSVVGEQKGIDGSYGPLYSYGVQVIERCDPLFFVAENVSGLSSSNDGMAFAQIVEDLENAGRGYRLTAHLYKFEQYGVPQKRHRIIIVGIRDDLGLIFKVPAPTTDKRHISARTALETPPIPDCAMNNEKTRQSQKVVERLRHTKPGENAWTANLPETLQLNVKGARLSQIYKRLEADKPSYTITGSGGGGTHGYHWEEPRALTNRERARLQTFPDDFIFSGSKESVRRQIGMAVPPVASKIIFSAILKTMGKVDYPSAMPNLNKQTSIFQSC